ncbi:MAG: helicase-related protein, partial [Pseudomonadota bacterium]
MSDFKLRKNPETGQVFFWENGATDWTEVKARRQTETGEVFVLGEQDTEWRNLGVYMDSPPKQRPMAQAPLSPSAPHVTQNNAPQTPQDALVSLIAPQGLPQPAASPNAPQTMQPAAPAPVPMEQPAQQNVLAQPKHGFLPPEQAIIEAMTGAPTAPNASTPFDGEGFGDLAKRRGQQFMRGLTEVPASVPEALAVAGFDNPNAAAAVALEIVQSAQAQIAQAEQRIAEFPNMNAEDRARVNSVISDAQKQIAAYQPLVDAAEGPVKPAAKDRDLFKTGDKVRQASQKTFGAPDPRDTSFWGKLAEGAGNMTGFVATSLLTGPLGAAGTGSALNSSQLYKEAIQEGASEEDARRAAAFGGALGLTEAVPIQRALRVLPPKLRGEVSNKFVRRLIQIGQSGGEEAIQETVVGIGNNLIAQNIYDPERGVLRDVGEQALIGAILGGGVSAVGQSIDAATSGNRKTPPAPDAPEPPEPDTPPDAPRSAPQRPQQPSAEDAILRAMGAGAETQDGGNTEIMGETEIVDGESVPTGRQVRVNLDTGEVTPVEGDTLPSPSASAVPPQQDSTGLRVAPAAPAGGSDPAREGTITTETLSSEEVARVGTDAQTFQYKDNGDEAGVTDRLRGVDNWDERSAMGGIVYEYADGRRVAADGHQRLGLAKRLQERGQQTPWTVEVIREADGFTPADVRRIAALKNIREGSGTAIDAAKVLREAPDEIDSLGLPPNSALVRDAKGLSRLSDDAFGAVVNGVVPEQYGAIVGSTVQDSSLQLDVIGLLNKLKPANARQAEMIAQQAGQSKVTETQTSLFGDEDISQSLYLERAKVLDNALQRIKKDRQTFKVLADRADTITEEGNVLNSTANAKRLETDAEMQAYLQAEANRKGVISDALTQAARRLKDNPSTISGVTNDFLSQIRNVDESVRQRGESADGERSRDEGQPESVDPSPEPAPTDPETDLLALMGAQQDAPATTKDSQKDEIKARQNQSKSRRLDGNTGSAGPLFDGQSDLFDAPTQSAAKRVGVFVDRTPDEKPQGQYKDLRDELPEAIPTDKLAAEAKRLTLEPGQRDGIEYLMMVDGDGQIVAYGSGHKSGTGVAPAFKLLESNDERIGMHHNHPSSNGFSSSDFSIALSPGADVVYAHGHDGSTFKMRATPKGRAAWPVEGLAPRWDAIRQELDRALHNMWRGNRPRISKLIDDGFYPPEQGLRDGNYRQPGRDRTFAFMMAMRDAGLIEIEVTGPAADRFEGKNPFIFDPELKKAYDRLVRGLKKRVPREGVQDDRRATTGRHPAELAGIPERTADVTGSDQRSDVEEDVSGRDPQSEKGDRGEGSQRGRLVDDVMAFRKVKAFSEETIESLTDKNLEAVHWLATNGYTGVALDASRTFAKVPNASHVRIDTIRAAQEGNGFPTPNESGVYNADDVKKGDSAKHFIGHTAKKGWKGVPSMEWAVLQVGDGKWLESASFSVPVSGSFGGLSGTQYFATREAALKKALGHLKKRVEGLIDSSTVPDTSQREAKQILDRVLQDAEAQGIDLSATEIPASDSDEVVSVRVTPEGPWDFNDTWPSPDVMLMAGARAEGRDEFDRGDVEEIVGVLDETMNNLVSELAAQRAWEDQVRKIESGEKPDFKKVKNETPLETAQREIATLERNIDDTLAAVADRWPQDAVDAMRAEAVRRVDQERVTSGKEATQNQPKPTEPDDFDAALDDVFGADLRAGAQSRADQETRKKRSKKAIADDIKGVLRGLEESSAAVRSDDGTYGKLRSLFIEALDGEDIEGKSQRGIFATMMRPLVDAGLTRDDVAKLRPFFTRFMEDVERGNIDLAGGTDAAGSSDSLERNSGDGDAGDRVGGTDVSASGGTDGNSTAAGTDASDGGNRRSTGSSGLPAGDATGVGARGNQSVRGENGTEPGASRDPDGTGSRSDRQSRLPDDKESDQETARHATDSADVDRAKAQAKADRTKVKFNDEQNIRDTLPLLMPEQQDDVVLIERRYASESGHGMLLTNGTGTGKTYSGGGVIKRMVQAGKSDILITAPDDGIMNAWIAMGRDLGIPISPLKDTKDAGEGVVVTTYANMGANKSLAKRDWDLIVTDEAHKLSQNAAGDSTNALKTLRVISNRPSERWARGYMVHADEWANWKDMADGDKKTALGARLRAKNDALKEKYEKQPRSKVLFLSATPFSYDKTLDYAEGYLFDYGSGGTTDSGSRQDGRAFFFVENFGYRIRYHKLTKPEGAVDNAVFEREFHEKLKRDGSLAGRSLTVSTDYDRKFVSTKSDLGDAIDAGMKYLREKQGQKSDPEGGWSKVQQYVNRSFKYHHRMQLLEQIKAEAAVKDIRAHVALGRKVVVFHDFNKGGGINPFRNPVDEGEPGYEQFVQFLTDNPKLANADFAAMRSPLRVMREEFGDQVAFYNGTETKADRRKAIQDFNDESSDIELIVVQADAGSAGISLHDTTGNRQRVLINLGMPPKPTTALQEEGRIRRVGVKTDAPFRYYTIGTTWERMAFADKIAGRSGTVENLALGNEARTIRDSFIDAYAEADVNGPSAEDGKGGMERDRADYTTSEFDRAKTHYYGRMKSTAKRNQRAGADFYATPEPLGYKMVEWAGMRANEKAMEPSVGDGAIGRYFPDYVESTIVDPSLELLSKARLRVTGAKAKNETFEKHHVSNKYDTVVMNPPFGSGGKLAYEHVAKALKHVRPGGRLVALVPTGPAADKQFSKMRDDLDETAEWNWTADVALPRVTFEKAGTNVGARVLIFDRVMDAEKMRPTQRINITGPDDIATFFERLEGIAVTARPAAVGEAGAIADAEGVVDSIKAAGRPAPPTLEGDAVSQFAVFEFQNTKTGETMYGAQVRENLGDRFKAVVAVAKSHNGYYSRYQNKAAGAQRGFLFKSDAERRAFMSDLAKPVVETDQRQPVQELSGDELGRHDTISGLRNAAKDWYKNNLIGTTAQTKEGWEVSFNGPGNRKSTSKGEDLLRLVPAIRSVIEQGDLVESRPGNRNPIRSVHFIAATVVINGDRKRVIVSIRETNSGTFHYELGWDGGVEQAQRSSVDGDPDDKRRFDPVWNQPVPDLNIMLVDEDFNFGQSQAAQEALISALPSLRAELDRLSLKRV